MPELRPIAPLAVAGATLGHTVGYGGASSGFGVTGHAYLDNLAGLVSFAGVAAIVCLAVRAARRIEGPLRWRHLAAAQTVIYLAQELAEHRTASVLGRPAVMLGLLAQPLVAALLVGLVRGVARAVERLLGAVPSVAAAQVSLVLLRFLLLTGPAPTGIPVGRRGPPQLRHAFI